MYPSAFLSERSERAFSRKHGDESLISYSQLSGCPLFLPNHRLVFSKRLHSQVNIAFTHIEYQR